MNLRQDWSPHSYLQFASERTRAAADLLMRVGLQDPRKIFDLGCGPGNSTALLIAAYPHAKIVGIDSSPAMITQAKEGTPGADYVKADLGEWQAPAETDLLFSNATFQWVPDHAHVMLRLLQGLKPGAVLAVQMPNNLNEPSHVYMRQVAGDERWAGVIGKAAEARERILTSPEYYDLLQKDCQSLDMWQTTYFHRLKDHRAIVDFVSSTGLRPFLNPLDPAQQASFKEAYEDALRQAYPVQQDGSVLLPFPRLFIVAQR